MKKTNLVILLIFCLCSLKGQVSNEISIGRVDSIESKILDEQRKLLIHIPEDFYNGNTKDISYPVVYLLDGADHFHSLVGTVQQLSSRGGNTICPKMIVIGIPNTNRTRDLTPDKGKVNPYVDSTFIANSGGGLNFMSFIENELIPYIDSNYPTQPYRVLIGHSIGGLTVVNTLINNPSLFNAYISIDPSMWWNDRSLLKRIEEKNFDDTFANKKMYLGIANTIPSHMNLKEARIDTTFETDHLRSILELNELLNNDNQDKISFKSQYYENDDHNSVTFIATYDALRFLFHFYELKIDMQEYMDPNSNVLEKIVNHYKDLSDEFGVIMKPDEGHINFLGYQYMRMKQYEKSELFFKLNVENYPASSNVYDSLGDLYNSIGEKEKAKENFKKSISLNENSITKQKLEELENK